jgi:hypothetical protein
MLRKLLWPISLGLFIALPVLAVLGALVALWDFYFRPFATVRYQLTVSIEANGEPKSASSNIEVAYVLVGAQGRAALGARIKGVSPAIDLGPFGMLLVSLDYHSNGRTWLQMEPRPPPPGGHYDSDCVRTPANLLENAFGLEGFGFDKWSRRREFVAAVEKLSGKQQMKGELAFIWFPKDGLYDQGKFLCPEKLSDAIGTSIALREVTVEILPPGAQIVEKLSIQAPWLDQIRISRHPGRGSDRNDVFVPVLEQVETGHA